MCIENNFKVMLTIIFFFIILLIALKLPMMDQSVPQLFQDLTTPENH